LGEQLQRVAIVDDAGAAEALVRAEALVGRLPARDRREIETLNVLTELAAGTHGVARARGLQHRLAGELADGLAERGTLHAAIILILTAPSLGADE
jgi:hypothetical protein